MNGSERALPRGWRWVKLGEVCDLNPSRSGFTPREDSALTSFVPMSAVDEVMGTIPSMESRPYREVKKGYTFFVENDVLFAKITPCMQNGKHAIARDLIDGVGFGSTEFHVLRPHESISPEWVHFFVLQPSVLEAAKAHFSGAVGQQRVPEDYLETLTIPLPPLPEQRRIASILKEQMAAVEKARAAAEAQLQAAQALPSAFLREVFPAPDAPLPEGWRWVKLGEVCDVKGGKRLPSGTDFSKSPTSFPYIRVLDFTSGAVRTEGLRYLDPDVQAQIARYIISKDDVYISIAGTIGIAGVIPSCLDGANLTENAARLIIRDKTVLDNLFLARYLSSAAGRGAIRLRTNTVGQPKLALERIETIPVPIAPLNEQRLLAVASSQKRTEAKRLEEVFQVQLAEINALPSALLRQAFSGQL